jgi:hypothetical protein
MQPLQMPKCAHGSLARPSKVRLADSDRLIGSGSKVRVYELDCGKLLRASAECVSLIFADSGSGILHELLSAAER